MRAIVLKELDQLKIAEVLKSAAAPYAVNENWEEVAAQIVSAVKQATGGNVGDSDTIIAAIQTATAAAEGPFPNEAGVEEEEEPAAGPSIADAVNGIIDGLVKGSLGVFPEDGGLNCQKCGSDKVKGFYRPDNDLDSAYMEWLCHDCGSVYQTDTKDA